MTQELAKPERRYYRLNEICQMYGISRPTLWRWQRDGKFPQSVRIGPGTPAISAEDLEAWEESLKSDAQPKEVA